MTQPILIERGDDGVATVTLNNPAKRNALTKPMWAGLRDAMVELSADESLRCVVVRGAGDEAFAAGADISEFETARADAAKAKAYDDLLREALEAIAACTHPTVALVQGACVGGGLEIAIHCDIRIAAASAKFGAPVARLGMSMPCPEIEAIVHLAGPAVALEMLLESRVLSAADALERGLVTRVAEDDAVVDEAYAAAKRIAAGPPLVNRWHKAFVRRVMQSEPVTEGERAKGYFYYGTEDFREGLSAFLGKRKPAFKGK